MKARRRTLHVKPSPLKPDTAVMDGENSRRWAKVTRILRWFCRGAHLPCAWALIAPAGAIEHEVPAETGVAVVEPGARDVRHLLLAVPWELPREAA